MQSAVLDEGVHHRAALAGFDRPKEEPVFLAQGGRTNGVLDQTIVDLHFAVNPRITTSPDTRIRLTLPGWKTGATTAGKVRTAAAAYPCSRLPRTARGAFFFALSLPVAPT